MNIEKQVVSLELAKELKEAGYPQESLFYHVAFASGKDNLIVQDPRCMENFDHEEFEIYSAPTVAELGEALPEDIEVQEDGYFLRIDKYMNEWTVGFSRGANLYFPHKDKSEANARALMLLYLAKEGIIKLNEL
ncbi:MAG: hypothetical protein ACTSQE_07260 [Candidatus Heimdallarchaeaceae archaeon]